MPKAQDISSSADLRHERILEILQAGEACGRFFRDTMFIPAKALVPAEGACESSMATLRIRQLMAQRSSRVVPLVEGSRFGRRAVCKVLDIGATDVVITGALCPSAALRALRKAGPQVMVAPPVGRGAPRSAPA